MANTIDRKKPSRQTAAMPVVPFSAAAHEHVEPAFDVSATPGAAAITLGPFDVPAYGFLRHIFLYVSLAAGTAGTATADAPWSIFQEITLLDVNGAPIFGPFTGYQAYLANLFGGYAFKQDPALAPDYVGATPNFVFGLRIPVEINHNNGLGALANQNAAAAYKVRIVLNPIAASWSVAPSPVPVVRVRGYLEAWSQPTDQDIAGRPQAIAPPQHGTTQFWSVNSRAIVSGQLQLLLPRVGNLIRTLVLVTRDGSGIRQGTLAPDPITINWDARQLKAEPLFLRRTYMAEEYTYATLPTGVYAYPFTHDVLGHAGDGTPELWLPTVQSSRLEIAGVFGGAGLLEILTNDVAPVEINPAQRFVEGSATGYQSNGAPSTAVRA